MLFRSPQNLSSSKARGFCSPCITQSLATGCSEGDINPKAVTIAQGQPSGEDCRCELGAAVLSAAGGWAHPAYKRGPTGSGEAPTTSLQEWSLPSRYLQFGNICKFNRDNSDKFLKKECLIEIFYENAEEGKKWGRRN